jgi:hypothetical protein
MKGATLLLWAIGCGLITVGAVGQTVDDACISPELPDVIVSPSTVGEVAFKHRLHSEDLQIPCADCHHETNAVKLKMPHEEYLQDFWIDCTTCHHAGETPACPQACSSCHHGSPHTIADETLSSKVVIHESCWSCHEISSGSAASRNCGTCHQGARTSETHEDGRHEPSSPVKEVEG